MHKEVPCEKTPQQKVEIFMLRHSKPVKTHYILPERLDAPKIPEKQWEKDCFFEDIDIQLIQLVIVASRKRVKALLTKNKGDLVKTVADLQDGK